MRLTEATRENTRERSNRNAEEKATKNKREKIQKKNITEQHPENPGVLKLMAPLLLQPVVPRFVSMP